ncbi:hypothetical protein [Lacimicrobium sp. SS2-24]|uniref:hypothetical protein n=1 Tax=Lacimicrobium sp. SS2-24 TaxID=2005569 RepID=UPI000B4A681E|nr:hypothetical protein [Lacimicrobium sp. SS2-24]
MIKLGSGWNIRHLLYGVAVVTGGWSIAQLTTFRSFEASQEEHSVEVVELEVSQLQHKKDFNAVLSRLESLDPREDNEQVKQNEEQGQAASSDNEVVTVDKTLKPRFQQIDDNYQVGLTGLFDDSRPFAVLERINFVSKQSEYVRLNIGERIGKYELLSITETSATLVSENDRITLRLFKREQ